MRIFVFGSNLKGLHGKGAALTAKRTYGAQMWVGEGPTGDAYALPTKDRNLKPRPLEDVQRSVEKFLRYANSRKDLEFMVTKIGCGYAGFTEAQIKPMFAYAPENCILPDGWREKSTSPPTDFAQL